MLTLLSPTALWTLAALALPLAIHLWRQPPRTVRLGTLRFLRIHAGRRIHDLRWRERLLLLARLGLLVSLVGLLARPVWQRPPTSRPQRWIVLDPAATPAGLSSDRLRALQAAGYAMRTLGGTAPIDLWSLLRETDASLPAGSNLAVFSPARLASLRGVRPTLRSNVEWIQTPDVAGGAAVVTPTAQVSAPPSVAIFHDADRAEDARYVAAAIRAALEIDGKPLQLSSNVIQPNFVLSTDVDWIFWLSAAAPPDPIQGRLTHLLEDARQATDAVNGRIVPQSGAAFASDSTALWRRGPAPTGAVFWTDERGVPLLTLATNEHGEHWYFASRFHPAWTDLPRTAAFAGWIRTLLLPAPRIVPSNDLRHAAPGQASPQTESPPVSATLEWAERKNDDLHWPLWAIVACLFVAERTLSHHRRSAAATAPLIPPLAAAR